MLAADFVWQVIGDRELQEVAGDSFVTQDRSWVFDGRANVEILALRIVSRDEIKTRRVLVVNARRIHEAAGTRRLERFGQLANFKAAKIRRQRDQLVLFQETDHFGLA